MKNRANNYMLCWATKPTVPYSCINSNYIRCTPYRSNETDAKHTSSLDNALIGWVV